LGLQEAVQRNVDLLILRCISWKFFNMLRVTRSFGGAIELWIWFHLRMGLCQLGRLQRVIVSSVQRELEGKIYQRKCHKIGVCD
jgi:hypothetical protein